MSFTPSLRRSSAGSHSRGSSLPTFSTPSPKTPEKSDGTKRSTSPWKAKFQRPSVMGHFPSISESEAAKSRPSFGSTDSYSPSRPSLDATASFNTLGTHNSVRSSPGFAKSSHSLWSLPPSATHINDPPGSTKLVSQPSKSTIRIPFSLKPSGHNPPGSTPSLISNGRRKNRRKRLVIGGIPLNDYRRYEAAKRWCEVGFFSRPRCKERSSYPRSQSFGEIGSIARATNGDILVDFRKSEVADTVCSGLFLLSSLLICVLVGVSCSSPCQHHWSWQLFPLVAYPKITPFVEVSVAPPTHPSFYLIRCKLRHPRYPKRVVANHVQPTYSSRSPGPHVLSRYDL